MGLMEAIPNGEQDGDMNDLVDRLTLARISEVQRARQQQLEEQRLVTLRESNAALRKVFADVIGKETIRTIIMPGKEDLLIERGVGNLFGPPHMVSQAGPRLLDHAIGVQAMHFFEVSIHSSWNPCDSADRHLCDG